MMSKIKIDGKPYKKDDGRHKHMKISNYDFTRTAEPQGTEDSQSEISTSRHSIPSGSSSMTSIGSLTSKASSRSLIKINQRTKLSTQDIKLIYYLIATIKPFKYIGDRRTSQTKKWEIIQRKYEETKKDESEGMILKNVHNEIIVPTVRTLQRQLAGAIKRSKSREEKSKNKRKDESELLYHSITKYSPVSELEDSLLELHELSETLKNGKGLNQSSTSTEQNSEFDKFIHTKFTNPIRSESQCQSLSNLRYMSTTDDQDSNSESCFEEPSKKSTDLPNIDSNVNIVNAFEKITGTNDQIMKGFKDQQDTSIDYLNKSIMVLNSLIHQDEGSKLELEKVVEDNLNVFMKQNEALKFLIENNNLQLAKQSELNKMTLIKAVEKLTKNNINEISSISPSLEAVLSSALDSVSKPRSSSSFNISQESESIAAIESPKINEKSKIEKCDDDSSNERQYTENSGDEKVNYTSESQKSLNKILN